MSLYNPRYLIPSRQSKVGVPAIENALLGSASMYIHDQFTSDINAQNTDRSSPRAVFPRKIVPFAIPERLVRPVLGTINVVGEGNSK